MGGWGRLLLLLVAAAVAAAAAAGGGAPAWRGVGAQQRPHPERSISVGLIVPHTNFGVREYIRAVNNAIASLNRSKTPKLTFLSKYHFTPNQVHSVMMQLTPSPKGELLITIFDHVLGETLIKGNGNLGRVRPLCVLKNGN